MKRIDTATKAVDLFGAGKHGFKAGNVLAGESPTKLNAPWFNHVQEELANLVEVLFGAELDENTVNQLATLFALKFATPAPLEDAPLTGNPTAPTQALGNNSTRLANTAFVQAAIAALVDSSPGALDTLNELAEALGDDPNFATTVTNLIAAKLSLSGGTLTNFLTLHANPVNALHAVPKQYVDYLVGFRLALTGGTLTDFLTLHANPTNALHAATKQYVDNLLDAEYESGEIAISLGNEGSVLHGLGGKPFYLQAFARCKTADRDWSVGDELKLDYGMDSLSGYNVQLAMTSTHIKYRFGANALVLPNGAGQSGAATVGSWRLIIRARR